MSILQFLRIFMYFKLLSYTISRQSIRGKVGFLNFACRRQHFFSTRRTFPQHMDSGLSCSMEATETSQSSAPPATMINFLQSKIASGLENWKSTGTDKADTKVLRADIAQKLIDNVLMSHNDYSKAGNKKLYDIGLSLSKALRATPGNLKDIASGSVTVQTILSGYKTHLEANRAVFTDITKHHESLLTQPWEKAVAKQTSLQTYADAANAMGQKAWVKEGNQWMENFAISFFRRNGARKDYLKTIQHNYTPEEFSKFSVTVPRDLMALTVSATTEADSSTSSTGQTGGAYEKIKLLDVGSCYNPIAKSENASAFDVTALDLCPVDSSVHQCDFLALQVGSADSNTVFEPSSGADHSVADSGSGAGSGSATSLKAAKLLQLPAASYDVVTMSLVLNYLPSPEKRVAMICKARQLLRPPGYGGQPHRAGLLLIIEKESIFSYDVVNQTDTPCNKNNLMSCWKEAIRNCGFELVKYRNLLTSEDSRRCHAFAFRTVDIPPQRQDGNNCTGAPTNATGILSSGSGVDCTNVTMWIKQDFVTSDSNSSKEKIIQSSKLLETVRSSLENVQKAAVASSSEKLVGGFVASDASASKESRLPVAVVGGGLGGVALTLALQTRGLPVAMFEKDSTFSSRPQGYALTIQQGLTTLRMIGLGILEQLQRGEKRADGTASKEGVTSLAHESYNAQGELLGAYGASARKQAALTEGASTAVSMQVSASGDSDDSIGDVGGESDDDDSAGSDHSDAESSGTMARKEKKGRRNVHIPRQRLREILLSHINPSNIQWNKRLLRFEDVASPSDGGSQLQSPSSQSQTLIETRKQTQPPNRVKLYFEDGSEFECSVLVAADGIHSTIRRQLFGSKARRMASPHAADAAIGDTVVSRGKGGGTGLQYLGLMVILGISPVVMGTGAQIIYSKGDRVPAKVGDKRPREEAEISPDAHTLLNEEAIDNYIAGVVEAQGGRRQIQWLDGTTRIFTMPFDGRSTMWQLSFPLTEEHALSLSASPKSLKDEALRRCAGWHAPLVAMLQATSDELVSGHPAYDREPLQPQEIVACTGNPGSRVTLIGDAAHPMSPFKAQGANQALLDARSLTRALVASDFGRPGKGRRSIAEALRSYETEMCARSAVKVLKSRTAAQYLHSPAALAEGNVTRAYAAEGAAADKIE